MENMHGSVIINDREAEPLSNYVIKFIKSKNSETPYLDFKLTIDKRKGSDFPQIVKHIFAMSNYGGGWIAIGWKQEKANTFIPVGLPEDYELDQSTLQEKFNSYINEPITLDYTEIKETTTGKEKRFGFIFIPPSAKLLTPNKDGKYFSNGKEITIFKKEDIFYRRGTQSVHPSQQELEIITKRLKNENYRLSILSGEPDEINENIFSNLFELVKIPEYVYLATKKQLDDSSIKFVLKSAGVFPEFFYKFKEWNKQIITFENLSEETNPYTNLIDSHDVHKELVMLWLNDPEKSRIIMELLNRELTHYAIARGLYYDKYSDKLFYPTSFDKRFEQWPGRYSKSKKQVAAKIYASQLQRYIFYHAAIHCNFLRIGDKIFFRILPTFIITEDGKRPISGEKEGTIITRLSYNRYNSIYLNNILFWIHQLGTGQNIKIKDYLEILANPTMLNTPVGILFDIPSSEFRLKIENDELEETSETDNGEDNYDL